MRPLLISGNLGFSEFLSRIVSLPFGSIMALLTSWVEFKPSILKWSISWSAVTPSCAQFSTFTLPSLIKITGFPTTRDLMYLLLIKSFTIITTKDQINKIIKKVEMEIELL